MYQHPNIKTALAIAALLALSACGGGGTETPASGNPGNATAPANAAPTRPANLEVTSSSIVNLSASWSPASDDNTANSQIKYEVHASVDEAFSPNSTTLLKELTGETSVELNSAQLVPGTRYFVKVVAVDKQGLRTPSESKSVAIETIEITPTRAAQGVPTVFKISGVGLPQSATFGLENCTATNPQPRQTDATGRSHLFSCAPKSGANTSMKGTLTYNGVSSTLNYRVTATDVQPTALDMKKLPFKQERISLARIPINDLSGIVFPPALLLKCSKVEMRRVSTTISVPETRCDHYRDSFGFEWPYNCRTDWVSKEVSTDVPTVYVGDQEFTADVDINLPQTNISLDDIKSDLTQVITSSVRSALDAHVNGAISQLKSGLQSCAIKAGAVAVSSATIAGYASGGAAAVSAATESFIGVFQPCAEAEVERSGARLLDFSEALNTIADGTKKDVAKYLEDKMKELKPQLAFGSQCSNWHPL